MKTLLTIVATSVSIAMSGCATDPAADATLSRHFDPVEAHQKDDLSLGCADLSANIDATTDAIVTLDKQIANQQQASNSFSLISALAGVSGAYAPNLRSAQLAGAEGTMANAGAQIEANQAFSTKDLRAMYQSRHDTLMEIYYGKNCKSS